MTITAVKAARKMAAGRNVTVAGPPFLWDPSAASDATGTLPNAQTGQTWAYTSTWNTTGGAGQAPFVASTDHYALASYATKDGTFFLDVTLSPTVSGSGGRTNIGLIVAAADASNFLMASIGCDTGTRFLQIYKKIGGTFTLLTAGNGPAERQCLFPPGLLTSGIAIGSTHRIGINKSGTTVKLIYGGKVVDTATITAGDNTALGTTIGLRSFTSSTEDDGGSRFNRLVATV